MTRFSIRKTSGISLPMKVGLRGRQWIPSPPLSTPQKPLWSTLVSFVPWARMRAFCAPLRVVGSRSGNCRAARRATENHAIIGAWVCAWDPICSGLHSQMASDLDATPPGIRKVGFRELMGVPRCPGQVGYPPSVATDAQLGFSVLAYQSAEILFDRCEGGGRILVRILGTCTRAPQGGKKGDITQRAEARYCPCCARPAHVAAPSRYSAHKAHGLQLRKDHGPWTVRYFAVVVYESENGCLPFDWDWAARSLILKPPTLFDGHFGTQHSGSAALPPPPSPDTSEGPSKPTQLSTGVTSPSSEDGHPPPQRSSPDNASIPTPPPTQPSVSQPRGGHREAPSKMSQGPTSTNAPHSTLPMFETSYRPTPPTHTPRTTESEETARERYSRTHSGHRPPSSYRGNSRAPSNRSSKNASDWKKDWHSG